MKIVQVTPYYPPHLGGVEGVASRLSEALAAKGHSVTVLTSRIGQKKNIPLSGKNISIKTMQALEFAHIPFAPSLLPGAYTALKQADIMHVHAGIAYYPEMSLLAARLLHKPFVVTFHCDTEPSSKFGFLLPIYDKLFLKHTLGSADAVVCLTEDNAKLVNEKYGVAKEKIKVISNGVDDFFFSFRPKKSGAGKKNKKGAVINLLFVGRLAKQKNLPRLIEAVKILSEKHRVLLRIVGSGEEEQKVRELVRENGLKKSVVFLGAYYKSEEEIPKWRRVFAASDIFVVPSDYEGLPLALMEAMAAGVPAVVTNVHGVREFAKGIAAFAKPEPEELAAVIEKVFYDVHLRNSLF